MARKRNVNMVNLSLVYLLILLVCCSQISSGFLKHLSHKETKKLAKLALAASLFTPSGFGVLPIPLPMPVPFSVESVKPPIIHPFHPGFPIFHGGFGHGGGLGGGFGGGFGGGQIGGFYG